MRRRVMLSWVERTITDVGGTETTTDITAAGVTIRNATGVGVDAGNSLNLDADTLTITTLSGNAFITEANGIGLGTVNVVANDLTLEAIWGILPTARLQSRQVT